MCQNRRPKCLCSKVMVKDVFLLNGGQGNVMRLRTSHVQTAQDVNLNSWKGPNQSYSVLKFPENLSSRNRNMAQNVILQVYDLERSRLSMKVKWFSIRPLPPTHKYMYQVSLKFYCQFFRYDAPIVDQNVARKRKKEDAGRRRKITKTL